MWACAVAATAVYFATAVWLDRSYVSRTPKGNAVVQLLPPFESYNHALIGRRDRTQRFDHLGDDEKIAGDARSPIVVYENTTPLGPAHSNFADIDHLGAGRFAHWPSQGIVFSTSDNSDPTTNGRRYWAVQPD